MPVILAFFFLVLPLIEIAVLIQVGQQIGALPTIALLIIISIAGAVLSKREGMAVWRRFQAALGRGEIPSTEILDGVLVIFAGALLLTPGFISDILGLSLLLPPTRAAVRKTLVKASKWMIARRFPVAVPINMAHNRVKNVKARRVSESTTESSKRPPDPNPVDNQ